MPPGDDGRLATSSETPSERGLSDHFLDALNNHGDLARRQASIQSDAEPDRLSVLAPGTRVTTPYGDAVVDCPWGDHVDVLVLGGGLATFHRSEVSVRD